MTPANDPSSAPVYRFALLLTGGRGCALSLLRQTLEEEGERFHEIRDPHRLAWLVSRLRAVARRWEETGGAPPAHALAEGIEELRRLLGAAGSLNEPERCALALFYSGGFDVEEIAEILGMDLEGLGGLLFNAREGLRAALEDGPHREPISVSENEAFLACHHGGWDSPRAVQRIENAAARDLILNERLRAQSREDERWEAVLAAIEVPPDFDPWRAAGGDGKTRHWLHPAMLSVLAGLLMIAGCVGWLWLDQRSDFPGRQLLSEMVLSARAMSGSEMQPIHLMVGELSDLLYMRGFEGYRVPPGLARQRAVGCRVFKLRGVPVAQIAVDSQSSLLYLFRSSELGVQLPDPGRWRVLECGELTAAVREEAGVCAVISFRGGRQQMDDFLKTLKP